MKISRELAIKILKYLDKHKNFYFPFLVMCREYSDEDNDFVEIEPDEWINIQENDKYQTFELWENLQNLDRETLELMAKGFIEKIESEEDSDSKLKKYKIEITETLQRIEEVEAGDKAEAFDKIREQYKQQEIILDADDFVGVEFGILKE